MNDWTDFFYLHETAIVLVASKMVLILVAAAVAIMVEGTAVAIPLLTQSTLAANTSSLQNASSAVLGSVLELSSASVPIDIPLIKGYENGNEIFFIVTYVSDQAMPKWQLA